MARKVGKGLLFVGLFALLKYPISYGVGFILGVAIGGELAVTMAQTPAVLGVLNLIAFIISIYASYRCTERLLPNRAALTAH